MTKGYPFFEIRYNLLKASGERYKCMCKIVFMGKKALFSETFMFKTYKWKH